MLKFVVAMKFFNQLAFATLLLSSRLDLVTARPQPANVIFKRTTSSAKSSTTTAKTTSKTTPITSTKATLPSTSTTPAKTSSTTSSTTSSYPTPTVPIGAGGGPFATVQGRMFQIQSKTQFFAGKYCNDIIHTELIVHQVQTHGGLAISRITPTLIMSSLSWLW